MVNDTKGLSVDEMKEMKRKEYFLSDYEASGYPKLYKDRVGVDFSVQYYRGKHENEYVIKNEKGDCCLYRNGLLKMIWKEDDDGNRMGEFVSFDKGLLSFVQSFDNLLNGNEWIRMINDKRGELMEIWKGDIVIYRGGFNKEFGREGIGIVYNEENGEIEYEGLFKNNELNRIRKIFEGNEMTEFADNSNLDVSRRIPIYVGGYTVDENDGSFKRDGLGYLISGSSRGAFRECVYENGKEVRGIDLFDGWYHKNSNHPAPIQRYPVYTPTPFYKIRMKIDNPLELKSMDLNVTHLVVASNHCNEVKELDLNDYKLLRSIEIGDDCFENLNIFNIDGLNYLRILRIGKNSFTHAKKGKWNRDIANNVFRTLSISNCNELELIDIGEYSFSDYGGGFELKGLPKLLTIKVDAYNFCYSSFVVKCIIDMILLMNSYSEVEFY